ncbi:MAG: NAD(+)/NADH kinase [Chloroflexota bacterium]
MTADWDNRMQQPAIERVGLLYQTKRDAPAELVTVIERYLRERRIASFRAPLGGEEELLTHSPQLLVTLGGDGSMLRAARYGAAEEIPIFGINFGRLGFLTECRPGDWQPTLDLVLAGEFRRERRAMLSVRLEIDGTRGHEYLAVNDVALTRGDQPRAIRARLAVANAGLGEIVADGIVCATATGSTGYNLSNGGPILPPEYRGFVVTAVAPHLSWFRPLLLAATDDLELKATGTGGVILTVDGQVDVPMQPDQHVHVCVAGPIVTFARTRPPQEFYATLPTRLQTRS